jgi:hypothetical protein
MVLQQTRYYTPENHIYYSKLTPNIPPDSAAATTPCTQSENDLHETMTHLFPTESPETDPYRNSTTVEEISTSTSFPEVDSNCKPRRHTEDGMYYRPNVEENDFQYDGYEDEVEENENQIHYKHEKKSTIPSVSYLMSQSKKLREKKHLWRTTPHDDENDDEDDDDDDDSYSDGDDEELLKIEVRKK